MSIEAKSYWDGDGLYQKEYDKLWDEFVPSKGFADNKYINLLIVTSKRYYDNYNNGLCNEDVIWKEFNEYSKDLLNELDCSEECKTIATRYRLEIREYQEPVYVWDDENEWETDEIDYYEDKEEEVVDEFTEEEEEQLELFVDAVIKLVYSKMYNK